MSETGNDAPKVPSVEERFARIRRSQRDMESPPDVDFAQLLANELVVRIYASGMGFGILMKTVMTVHDEGGWLGRLRLKRRLKKEDDGFRRHFASCPRCAYMLQAVLKAIRDEVGEPAG